MSFGHLGVFFGEMSVHVFCPSHDWIICSWGVEFDEFYIDFFLKILFIYLTERETPSERGNTGRGSG